MDSRGKRSHVELVGQGQGVAVVALGRMIVGRLGGHRDVAQDLHGPGFLTAFATLTSAAVSPSPKIMLISTGRLAITCEPVPT